MNDNTRKSPLRLSRAPGDRVLLGSLALTIGTLTGVLCWHAFFESKRPIDWSEAIAQFVVHDAFVAVFILCVLAVVWAMVAPRWMERLLERRARAACIAVLLAVPIVALLLWLR